MPSKSSQVKLKVISGASPGKLKPNAPKYLAEHTLIAGVTWNDLKAQGAMDDDFEDHDWYDDLNDDDLDLLDALREAQFYQGDNNIL